MSKSKQSKPRLVPYSLSSSSESDNEDDEIQSKQTSNLLSIQTTYTVLPHTSELSILPAKLHLLQTTLTNKSTVEYQRLAWETLKETINNCVNKVNILNLRLIIRELFENNVIRGRGLLAHAIIQAQIASPSNTFVYAALVSVINRKFPQIGELITKLLISSFSQTYQCNDKKNCLTTIKFLAHLVNQNVLHEIVALEILALLFEDPYQTNDSAKLGIQFLKECGQKLSAVSSRGLNWVFSRLRDLLHNSSLDQRTRFMIESIFATRKDQFKAYAFIPIGLDLVYEKDQYTHMVTLDDQWEPEPMFDVFQYDEQYEKNERKYKQICKRILDKTSDDEYESSENCSSNDDEDDQKKNDVNNEKEQTFYDEEKEIIIHQTETDLVTFRETVRLTIESSYDQNERVHKLLQMNLRPGHEIELCQMILDFCVQKGKYVPLIGSLGIRLCKLKKEYMQSFEKIFRNQYEIIHRLERFELIIVSEFFIDLLGASAISWKVFDCIRLTKKETTSLSRLFLKNLFFGLFKYFGFIRLNRCLNDPTLIKYFDGIFPRDTEENTEFAINFFTSIGLGGLTYFIDDEISKIPLNPSSSSSSSSGSSSIHSNSPVSSGGRTPTSTGGGVKAPFSTLNNSCRATSLIGQTVRIAQGPYKGYVGIVKDAN